MKEPVKEPEVRSLLTARLAARLGIAAADLDPRERFSRYGLDSAGATGWIAELAQELGRPLSPTLVWAYPSLEELARHLAGEETAPVAVAAPVRSGAPVHEPIAIVGMACRFPGAPDLEAFWRMLCDGVDATEEVPADRWDAEAWYDPDPLRPGRINTRRGAFLDRIDEFDPLFFGIAPREASEMDPQQRLILELAWEALEDAGIPPRGLAGSRTGVFVGVIAHDYAELHRMSKASVTQHTGPGTSLSIVANRVSYLFGLRGPSLSVDTACSSSLVSVHLACQSLRNGEADLALAAGVNLVLTPELTVELTKFGGLSGDGRCKAFDARANGFARGEGGGLIVLKPLSRALADGDRIWCLIRGGAVNNDGFSNGLTAPSPQAQVEVLTDAYARARVDPLRVRLIEAHGTGTRLGDPIEARALASVLCAGRDPSRPLLLGSAKTNIAHQEGAAGIAGLIKLALSIHHRAIPPSLHFETPNPDIPFEELRLRVVTALEPWPGDEPAVGGVSSFGWGGTNCHMVLEELPESRAQILLLAAESTEEMRALVEEALTPVPSPARPPLPLPERKRGAAAHRLAVTFRSRRELAERLEAFLGGQARPGMASGSGRGQGPVFVYAGMGWQWPGMMLDLLRSEPLVRARLERCDRLLRKLAGWSLLDLLATGTMESWMPPAVSVPGLLAIQVALTDLWRSWGIEPAAVIGHSCGEIAAAWAAGVLGLEDALRAALVYGRTLMRIEGHGTIGVVALPPEEVQARVDAQGLRLEISGWLSPASTSVAGEVGDVERLLADVKAEGRFAARVAASVAAHTVQVEPHLDDMRAALADLAPRRPVVPLMSTLTGDWLDRPMDGAYWAENLRQPVLLSQGVQKLLEGPHPRPSPSSPHTPAGRGETRRSQEEAVLAFPPSPGDREGGAGRGVGGEGLFLNVDAHPVLVTPLEQGIAHAGARARVLPTLRRQEDGRSVLFDSLGVLWAAGLPVRAEQIDPDPAAVGPTELLPLSARAPEALRDLARATAERLRGAEAGTLGDFCHAAAVRRSHHGHRLALAARSRGAMAERLEAFARGEEVAGAAVGRRGRGERGGVVFAFAGQGPQHPAMGRQLLESEPVFRAVVEQCDEIARPLLGLSFLEGMREEGALDHTAIAQPALFALQAGLAALWRSWGIEPEAVVGHSVGEIAAAWACGALSLEEGVRVAVVRGQAMEAAHGKGKMAAVELSEDEARAFLQGYGDRLCIAAVNSPSSTVLAGETQALEEVAARLKEQGVTCRMLRVELAFHSPQMEPCDREVAAGLADLRPRPARLPMISTVTGGAIDGTDLNGVYWGRNVREPVRFAAAVEALAGSGVFLEIGPHPVLSVAITQTLEASVFAVFASLRRGRDERETLLEALGGLWVLGLPVDWTGVHPDGGRMVRLPSYPFQRQRYWFEVREADPSSPPRALPWAKESRPLGPETSPENADGVSGEAVGPKARASLAQGNALGGEEGGEESVERLLAEQLDAFNRMVALQLDVLGRTGSI